MNNPQAPGPANLIDPGPAPQRRVQYWEDYTAYEVDFTSANLTNGATLNGAIQIQADSYFKWTKAAFYADIGGAVFTDSTRPIPQVTVQIQDSGSGRVLFNQAVPVVNVFGTGQLPFILPIPRIFMPRSSLALQVANYSTASAYNLRLTLIGTKIFQGSDPLRPAGY